MSLSLVRTTIDRSQFLVRHTCHCDTKTPLLLGPLAFPRGVKFHCEVQNQAAGEM